MNVRHWIGEHLQDKLTDTRSFLILGAFVLLGFGLGMIFIVTVVSVA